MWNEKLIIFNIIYIYQRTFIFLLEVLGSSVAKNAVCNDCQASTPSGAMSAGATVVAVMVCTLMVIQSKMNMHVL